MLNWLPYKENAEALWQQSRTLVVMHHLLKYNVCSKVREVKGAKTLKN